MTLLIAGEEKGALLQDDLFLGLHLVEHRRQSLHISWGGDMDDIGYFGHSERGACLCDQKPTGLASVGQDIETPIGGLLRHGQAEHL